MSFCCLPRCCQVLVIYPIVLIIEHNTVINSPNLSSWTFDDETAFGRFHTSPKVLVAPAGQDTVKPRPPATSSSLAYVSCCVCYNFSLDFYFFVQKCSFNCYLLQVSYENTSQDHRQPPLIIQVLFFDNWIEISCFSFPAWPLWTEGELHIPGKADSSFD